MKNTISSIIKEFIKVVIIVAIAVPTIALFAAWTGPTGVPPTNNADAPVNVSGNSQEKRGDLTVHRTEGGYDVGLFTTDIFSVLGGAIFNKNSLTDDKKVVVNTDGNVGIGTVSPQTPAPNGNEGNVDVNDVYLRSTSQWVSQMNGVTIPNDDMSCVSYQYSPANYIASHYAKTKNGLRYVRAKIDSPNPAYRCDSGWKWSIETLCEVLGNTVITSINRG